MARSHWLKVDGSFGFTDFALGATRLRASAIGILAFSTPRRLKQKNSPGASAARSVNSIFEPLNCGASAAQAVGSSWQPMKDRFLLAKIERCSELVKRIAVTNRSSARLRPRSAN